MKNGRKPKPCMMFDQCMNMRPVNNFSDVCNNIIPGPWYRNTDDPIEEMGFENIDEEPYIPKPFSKTSYNSFVSCPRKFMYMMVLRSPDKSSTVVGNLIHQYAEFRVCYPELTKKHSVDYYTEIIANKCTGLYSPEIRSVERSKIWVSLSNIDKFIEYVNVDRTITREKKIVKNSPNLFFELFNVHESSDNTELRYVSRESHMEGIFDLIINDTIYDYKTGKPAGTKDIVDGLGPNPNKLANSNKIKEFQCMFYLSLLDEIAPNSKKEFTLFYTLDNDSKVTHGSEYRIEDNLRHIVLIQSKEEYLNNVFKDEILDIKKYEFLEYCWDTFTDGIKTAGIDNLKESLNNESIADSIASVMKNTTKGLRDSVKAALRKISNEISGKEIFRSDKKKTVFVTYKALDDFRLKVWNDFFEAKKYYNTEYPARPIVKCEKCDFRDLCTATPVEEGEDDVEIE